MSWQKWLPSGVPPVNYPFHVAKALKVLAKLMHFIDTVLVVVDARAPLTTLYKDFKGLFGRNRHVVFIMGKADLTPKWATKLWIEFLRGYRGDNYPVFSADLRVPRALVPLREHLLKRSERRLSLNVLVVGAPNLGKSTLINSLVRRRKARVGNLPGVTRSLQWLKLTQQVKVLDSPGLMPPVPDNWLSYSKLALLRVIPLSSDLSRWRILRLLLAYLVSDERLRGSLASLRVIGSHLVRAGKALLSGNEEKAVEEILSIGSSWGWRDLERISERLMREIGDGERGRLVLELPSKDDHGSSSSSGAKS